MRKTYRVASNKDYWKKRWEEVPADSPMVNEDTYPLKYALRTVSANDGPILEAGCGAGRILRYFHNRGYDIFGVDFIEVAITKLLSADKSLKVKTGDISNLDFPAASFKYVLAFGLFHNLENNLDEAISETWRVLAPGGGLVPHSEPTTYKTAYPTCLRSINQACSQKTHLWHFIN